MTLHNLDDIKVAVDACRKTNVDTAVLGNETYAQDVYVDNTTDAVKSGECV